MFTFAISCLTTANLPWFIELTFQVPMQYCSLQHLTLLSPPNTSTAECHFRFDSLFIPSGAISPFFSSGILDTYQPGGFIFQCHIFLPFHTVHGALKAKCWSGLPFPSPVDHVLSELSTMTHPSWVALHSMVHGFSELDKSVVHVISWISFLWLWFSFCLPSDWWR